MSTYRTPARPDPETGPRWGVSWYPKLYVRVMRVFFDLRARYAYRREYRKYLRACARWDAQQAYERNLTRREAPPPRPLPPPVRIWE